jgi:para-nitrobenzyl esterase
LRGIITAVILSQALALTGIAGAQNIVTINTGKLKGSTHAGVTAFKGIPYAAPPVGKLRWRPPQPAAKWKGVRDATHYGHDCMQLLFPGDAAPERTKPSENCLYLNVWTPAHHTGKLPVMVWIYGGGWVNGGSSPAVYNGKHFAQNGIVFVSFNYRLGRFGFFAFPALTKASKTHMLGNYGYMDQIAALKWVQKNIAAFGGNPHDVTVFGQSAGGFSVHMLLTSPLTKGLFERAIIESGGGRKLLNSTGVTVGMHGRPSGQQLGVNFARSMGIEGDGPAALRKLRALPAKDIVDGMNMASMAAANSTYPGPMIDGKVVTAQPETLYEEGKYHHVPVIIGATNMDIGFSGAKNKQQLFAKFGANAKTAEKAYDAASAPNFFLLRMKVAADAMMVEPARFVAQTLSSQGDPAWEFRFGYVAHSMRSKWPGAPHASEIPYVFDTVKAKYGAATTAHDEKVAEEANAYWANFAKTGNPNGPGLPHWPEYKSSKDVLMDFTENGPIAKRDPWEIRLNLTEQAPRGHSKISK